MSPLVAGVVGSDESDKDTVRGRHERTWGALLSEAVGHLAGAKVRSYRDRTRLHDLLDRRVRIDAQRLGTDHPEHHPAVVDDDTDVPATIDALVHRTDALVETARRYIPVCDIARARRGGFVTFARQPCRKPVGLAWLIAVQTSEPER